MNINDFDHQLSPAEKYGTEYSYKNRKRYFPRVVITSITIYIEDRKEKCNVKTAQLSTHKRALNNKEIYPRYAKMDCGF